MSLPGFPGGSALHSFLEWYASATNSIVSGARQALSLCRRCAGHPGELLLAGIPQLDAGVAEGATQRISTNAYFGGDASDSESALIERFGTREKVTGIERRAFSGHVYNLETESGWYVANGIVTHNCRCTTVAVLDEKFAALNTRSVRPSVGPDGARQASAGISYYEWLKQQPAAFQDAAIGPRRAQLLRAGGLSADRFAQLQLDKQFLPMTLAEMRALEPLAFKEAGL